MEFSIKKEVLLKGLSRIQSIVEKTDYDSDSFKCFD